MRKTTFQYPVRSIVRALVIGIGCCVPISWWSVGALEQTAVIPENEKQQEQQQQHAPVCGLYLAPSSTSSSAEMIWGLYAGRDYKEGELIGNGTTLGVNLHYLKGNVYPYKTGSNGEYDGEETEEDDEDDEDDYELQQYQSFLKDVVEFLEGYLWVADPAGAKFETTSGDATSIMSFINGPGLLSAMNAKMTNAQWYHRGAYQGLGVGEYSPPGQAHPNRGAQSSFYHIAIQAMERIPQGTEIFLNYGANYDHEQEEDEDDDDDDDEEEEDKDLKKSDYAKLDATIQQMVDFFQKHDHELDEASKLQIYGFLTRDVMNAAVGAKRQQIIAQLLPHHPDQLQEILDAGGSITVNQQNMFRNVTWLEQEGYCADHIVYGPSTIPGAGRGAFATRTLPAGSTIAATPLLPIPDVSILDMHPLKQDGETELWFQSSKKVIQKQLALNYCFGHPESSLVFLPAGPGVPFINHNHEKPNAKLVWSNRTSSNININNKHWFQVPPAELMEQGGGGGGDLSLVMEIVALETIAPGQEVFLDYGQAWEVAWNNHVQQWGKRQQQGQQQTDAWPIRAVNLRESFQTKPYPTEQEDDDDTVIPKTVGVVAFVMIAESTAAGTLDDPKVWDFPRYGTVYDAANLFPVTIVDRVELAKDDYARLHPEYSNSMYNYTIRWLNINEEATYVEKVPHSAFVLVDQPEQSDQFGAVAPQKAQNQQQQTMVFRHPILIPDEIFPHGPWRNLVDQHGNKK